MFICNKNNSMKKTFLFLTILLTHFVLGQVGINTTTPRGALDVSSPQQNLGMVLPSVTKIEDMINPQTNDNNIPSGTIVFDMSRNTICIRYGNAWQCTDVNGQKSIVNSSFLRNHNYIKASNTKEDVFFGFSVSLSADGSTMAVGSYGESSNATGINGNESDATFRNAGAVYVYKRMGSVWLQEAYIKASNTRGDAYFGYSVSLSSDGSTMVVGSVGESLNAVEGSDDEPNLNISFSGAAYVYKRIGATWSQEAYIKSFNMAANAKFGASVSLSSDGSTMAVGSPGEDSDATGINGTESNISVISSGAVYVYKRTGVVWIQEAYIKAPNTRPNALFGYALSLSSDGYTLAVGSPQESSNTKGINNDESNESMVFDGSIYVYKRVGTTWSQEDYIKASNTKSRALFGYSVSLSSDGSTMAVGSPGESFNAKGINDEESGASMLNTGAVYVFKRMGTIWSQEAYIKASNANAEANFGGSVSLSSDGSSMIVGSAGESSDAKDINGDETNVNADFSGAAYVYKRSGAAWSQKTYIKSSNTRAYALFGYFVSLSSDGSTIAVGSPGESSNATGINLDESDTTMRNAGAVYIFKNE